MKIYNNTKVLNDITVAELVDRHIKYGRRKSKQSTPIGDVTIVTLEDGEGYVATYKYENYGRLD